MRAHKSASLCGVLRLYPPFTLPGLIRHIAGHLRKNNTDTKPVLMMCSGRQAIQAIVQFKARNPALVLAPPSPAL